MKKLFIGLLLAILSLGFAWLSFAADVKTFPSGTTLKIVIEPSPDPRADGHNLYYVRPIVGASAIKTDMKTQAEQIITAGTLTEGVEYEFYATAYGKVDGTDSESARSPSILLKILSGTTTIPGDPLVSSFSEDFKNYTAGSDPSGWLDTTGSNSMVEDDSLFKIFDVAGNKVFGTASTLTNIHSHHTACYVDKLAVVELSGQMMITDPNGAIGVTFLSRYPFSDTYYRLRRNQWQQSFHLAPHPHATAKNFGVLDSGVNPVAGQWYSYKIRVQDTGTRTEILAKVWPSNSAEPVLWQIDAYDDTPDRLTSGTIGVWSDGPGRKYWDNISVMDTISNRLAAPAIVEISGQ
jgi:hypothetical protein